MNRGNFILAVGLFAPSLLLAQNPQSNGGWRHVSDPPPEQQSEQPQQGPGNQGNYSVPPQLTIPAGAFVTVRVNQPLSSDRNQAGDAFTATLARPIVVDGVVIAQRGQTLAGRVAEAHKAGRVEGVSRLAVQLTDLTLVDGQQIPIQSQLLNRSGGTSQGRDAGAIAGTTGVGAIAGAAAGGGMGAGIGAAAGAVAGTVGVLLTRGHATVIYPESLLTFRIESPVTVSTERAPEAFRYVEPGDYDQPPPAYEAQAPPPPPPPPYYYVYGSAYYPGFYGPGFYGPGFSFFYGPRFYYRGGFYGRGRFRGYRR